MAVSQHGENPQILGMNILTRLKVHVSYIYIYIYIPPKKNYIYIYTWNLFVLYFGDLTLQNKVFSIQNRGHLGSRYIYTW